MTRDRAGRTRAYRRSAGCGQFERPEQGRRARQAWGKLPSGSNGLVPGRRGIRYAKVLRSTRMARARPVGDTIRCSAGHTGFL